MTLVEGSSGIAGLELHNVGRSSSTTSRGAEAVAQNSSIWLSGQVSVLLTRQIKLKFSFQRSDRIAGPLLEQMVRPSHVLCHAVHSCQCTNSSNAHILALAGSIDIMRWECIVPVSATAPSCVDMLLRAACLHGWQVHNVTWHMSTV